MRVAIVGSRNITVENFDDYVSQDDEIVDYADKVIVFWNGNSNGALSVIKYAEKVGKECVVVVCK